MFFRLRLHFANTWRGLHWQKKFMVGRPEVLSQSLPSFRYRLSVVKKSLNVAEQNCNVYWSKVLIQLTPKLKCGIYSSAVPLSFLVSHPLKLSNSQKWFQNIGLRFHSIWHVWSQTWMMKTKVHSLYLVLLSLCCSFLRVQSHLLYLPVSNVTDRITSPFHENQQPLLLSSRS